MKSLLITLYLAFIFATCTYAQVVSNPSPNVASFMVTKTFPSALPTGVPDITVPVYNMTYEGLTVPIELSYNVNAVKPDLHPSWVGLGWSLIAGGAINRVVNDKPDDLLWYSYNAHDKMPEITNVGYYYNHAALSGSDWSSTTKIEQYTDDWKGYESPTGNMYHPDFKYSFPAPFTVKDYQPDEFAFSFLGYSGTFYLNDAGQWQIRCDKHFKVESVINSDSGFTQFTLTDPQGIKYIFGNSAIESTRQVFAGDEQPYVNKTWYLVEILFPNGKRINFNYTPGNAQVVASPLQKEYASGTFPNQLYFLRLSCSVINPVYLTSISTENHTITFKRSATNDLAYTTAPFAGESHYYGSFALSAYQNIYEAEDSWSSPYNAVNVSPEYDWYNLCTDTFLSPYVTAYGYGPSQAQLAPLKTVKGIKLDTISILNKATGAIQKFSFNYIDTATERLKLLSMKQSTPASAKISAYNFAYDTTKISAYLSEETDTWGYYNGKTPQLTDTASFYASRAPDSIYAKAEILTGVIYPTGGSTIYDYELNTASKQYEFGLIGDTTANFFVGGLRIRKITHYKSTGAVADFTTYTYNKPGSSLSSGVLTGERILLYYKDTYTHANANYTNAYFTSIYPSENQNGSHIGYSYVTQHFSDGSSTLSQFSNFDTGTSHEYYDEKPFNSVDPHVGEPSFISSKGFLRGKLLDQKTYNTANTLLRERAIDYNRIYADSGYVRSLSTYGSFIPFGWGYITGPGSQNFLGSYIEYTVNESQQPTFFYGAAAKIYTYSYLPTTETNKLFNNPLHPIVTTKTYTYDAAKLNLLSTVTTNSKGQAEETDNLYPPNMVSLSRDPSGVYAAMTASNVISPAIETTQKVNSTQTVLNRTSYLQLDTNLYKSDSVVVQYGAGAAVTTMKYANYDYLGNPQTTLNKGVLPTSYIYDATGQFVVAKIENASSSNEVFLEDFEHSDSGTTGAGHSGTHYFLGDYLPDFHTPGSRAYVIDFWYHTTGNTWKYKKQPYVMHATLLPMGANALDDIRIYPADAEVTTYTNDPLAGLTSETDPRGNITYYEYDEFQRLVNIKDQYGNIKTHYCYNYAGQETDCAVSTVLPPPPVPPATGIYARVEISDVSVENSEDGDGGSTSLQTGNVCIKLYADPDGTIPLTLSSDLNITLTETTQVNDYVTGNSTDTEYAVYTIPAGNNSYCLGMMDLDDLINYLDEFGNVHYNESIYNYNLTSGSTIYTVIPTVYP